MKFAMFTPSLSRSAIGRSAKLLVHDLLVRGHEVIVVRTEMPQFFKEEVHDFQTELMDWNQQAKVAQRLRSVDTIVYHIGNNYEFHKGGLEWLPKAPGVVCLHDYFLGNLFWSSHAHNISERGLILRHWYGPEVAEQFFNHQRADEFMAFAQEKAPMTEWICSQALAVLTHSDWNIGRVLASCPGPVVDTPLAYEALPHIESEGNTTRASKSLHVTTIGHINPNKRAASVIQAIGNSPLLRTQVQYRLVGPLDEAMRKELESLASSTGVDISIVGEVDDEAFAKSIQDADVVSCLRWPALEAASATLVEAMLGGRAVLVTNTASYHGIPDDCVIKIDPHNEIPEITAALERLYSHPEQRLAFGERAKAYACDLHSPSRYVDALLELSEQVLSSTSVIDTLQAVASQAYAWGATREMIQSSETLGPLHIFEQKQSGNA